MKSRSAISIPDLGPTAPADQAKSVQISVTCYVIPAAQRAACEAHQAHADETAAKLSLVDKALPADGVKSLNGVAGRPMSAASERRRVADIGIRHRCDECSRDWRGEA
jgi:hypothetical protein